MAAMLARGGWRGAVLGKPDQWRVSRSPLSVERVRETAPQRGPAQSAACASCFTGVGRGAAVAGIGGWAPLLDSPESWGRAMPNALRPLDGVSIARALKMLLAISDVVCVRT